VARAVVNRVGEREVGSGQAGMPIAGYPPGCGGVVLRPLYAAPFACHESTEVGLRRTVFAA